MSIQSVFGKIAGILHRNEKFPLEPFGVSSDGSEFDLEENLTFLCDEIDVFTKYLKGKGRISGQEDITRVGDYVRQFRDLTKPKNVSLAGVDPDLQVRLYKSMCDMCALAWVKARYILGNDQYLWVQLERTAVKRLLEQESGRKIGEFDLHYERFIKPIVSGRYEIDKPQAERFLKSVEHALFAQGLDVGLYMDPEVAQNTAKAIYMLCDVAGRNPEDFCRGIIAEIEKAAQEDYNQDFPDFDNMP